MNRVQSPVVRPYGEREESPFSQELTIQVKKKYEKNQTTIQEFSSFSTQYKQLFQEAECMINCQINGANKFRGRKKTF